MKKITIQITEEVEGALAQEGFREFRTIEQQASYCLLVWSREQEKRQKVEKAVASSRSAETGNGVPGGSFVRSPV